MNAEAEHLAHERRVNYLYWLGVCDGSMGRKKRCSGRASSPRYGQGYRKGQVLRAKRASADQHKSMPITALTRDEVAEIVSRGTTEHKKVECIYVDQVFALVKWPGGSFWDGMSGHSYCSPWVDRYKTEDVIKNFESGHGMNLDHYEVWNCARDKDGPLTNKRKAELITREQVYDPECCTCTERLPLNDCPESHRPCGHHCDCSWTQDACCWCGEEFGEDPEA